MAQAASTQQPTTAGREDIAKAETFQNATVETLATTTDEMPSQRPHTPKQDTEAHLANSGNGANTTTKEFANTSEGRGNGMQTSNGEVGHGTTKAELSPHAKEKLLRKRTREEEQAEASMSLPPTQAQEAGRMQRKKAKVDPKPSEQKHAKHFEEGEREAAKHIAGDASSGSGNHKATSSTDALTLGKNTTTEGHGIAKAETSPEVAEEPKKEQERG